MPVWTLALPERCSSGSSCQLSATVSPSRWISLLRFPSCLPQKANDSSVFGAQKADLAALVTANTQAIDFHQLTKTDWQVVRSKRAIYLD